MCSLGKSHPQSIPHNTNLSNDLQVNDSKSFQVVGSLGPFLKGHHQGYFEPSKVTKGGTKFVIHEDFIGLVSFVLRRGTSGRADLDYTFDAFNTCLKKRTESMPR